MLRSRAKQGRFAEGATDQVTQGLDLARGSAAAHPRTERRVHISGEVACVDRAPLLPSKHSRAIDQQDLPKFIPEIEVRYLRVPRPMLSSKSFPARAAAG